MRSRYRRIDATSFCASTADLGPRLKTSTESSARSTRAVDPWLFVALLRRGFGACLPRCRRTVRNCAGLATLGVGRRGGRPRFARLLLRPSRRRQHPFQCVAAHFRRQVRVPRPLGRDKRRRARDCGVDGRLVLGRAPGEQLKLATDERPGRARGHAGGQSGARLERGEESGQAALTCRPAGAMDGPPL